MCCTSRTEGIESEPDEVLALLFEFMVFRIIDGELLADKRALARGLVLVLRGLVGVRASQLSVECTTAALDTDIVGPTEPSGVVETGSSALKWK